MGQSILITVKGSTNIERFNAANHVGHLTVSQKHPCTVLIAKGVLKAEFQREHYRFLKRHLSPAVSSAL